MEMYVLFFLLLLEINFLLVMGIVCELLKTPIDCCNANSEVFDLFLRDESKYFTFAREGTIKYAMDPGDELLRQSLGKKNSNSTSDAK